MANKVYNLNGGLYSGDAFTAFETRIASSNNGSIVASPSDLKVSAGSGMNVTVSTGAGIIGNGTLSGVRFAIDSPVTVAVSAASTANPRMDSVVAYIDKSVSASTSVVDNTDLGIVKFKSVAGTPASAPTAPSTATIQSSIGAGNPYMVLANITVPKSSSAASSFTIRDMRVTPTSAIITDNSITTSKLANKAVTSDKVDWATFKPYWKTVAISTSSNVTIPAGYRLYRVRVCGNKTDTNSWGIIGCSQATGTTWIYIQGMSNGTWIADERSVNAPSDKAVMDGARHSTQAGFQTWDITISKLSKTGVACMATWETGMTGSKTFNTGRSVFNVTDGTADMNLYCELSSALWSVEALVEN